MVIFQFHRAAKDMAARRVNNVNCEPYKESEATAKSNAK